MTPKSLIINLAESAYIQNQMLGTRKLPKPGETYLRMTNPEQRQLLQNLRSDEVAIIRPLPLNDGPEPRGYHQVLKKYRKYV